nr:lipopolysaccharide biosynthesis protein [uncultured Pedobacter sp.]
MNRDKQYNKWLETSHLTQDLKSHSISGGFNTVAGQVLSFGINILSTIILARLLVPGDYGLVAMVTTITGFITVFKDLGLSSAVIQTKELKDEQVNSIFWISIGVSFVIALIVSLLAPLLVAFYKEERLLNMTLVFAASIFVTGFSLQHNALMKRQMKFKTLSRIQIFSTVGSLLTGMFLAWKGFGYWSIVAISVSSPIYSTISLWFLCDWRPRFGFNSKGIKKLVSFGAGLTGFDLVNYFSRNMDNVLIGKFSGPSALGMYSKAYQLLLLPITQLRDPLNAVALPALSNLQNDKWKYNHFFCRYLFTLAFFSMPIVIYFAIFSHEIIFIVLGQKWIAASSIFKLLAISAFIQPVASTQGLLLITTGKAKKYFYLGIINSTLVVAGFCIGINWGTTGIAISYAIVTYALFIPLLLYSLKDSHLSILQFLEEICLPAVFALISGAGMFFVRANLGGTNSFLICIIGFFVGAIIYIGLWFLTKFTRKKMNRILEIGQFLINKNKLKA